MLFDFAKKVLPVKYNFAELNAIVPFFVFERKVKLFARQVHARVGYRVPSL